MTAGVRVDLGVEHEDVDVFAAGQYVVETAVADVVGGTVTTDNPLAALHEEVAQLLDLLGQFVAFFSSGVDERHHLVGHLAGDVGVFLVVYPALGELFHFGTRAVAHSDFLQQVGQTGFHLLVGHHHTQTKFAEVLKERVGPSGTLPLLVGGVGRGGDGARVDGRAAGGVGNHLTVAKELADELDVRCFAATRAGAGELKERCGKL